MGQEPRTGETRVNGRFLDCRVCSLGLFALTFQAQFDEVLPRLAVFTISVYNVTEPLREFTGSVTVGASMGRLGECDTSVQTTLRLDRHTRSSNLVPTEQSK